MTEKKIYTVTEINREAKKLLESKFFNIYLTGEVVKPTISSGHCYFTLKDETGSTLSAVLFRGTAAKIGGYPEHGTEIEVSGNLTIYERGGRYQVIVQNFFLSGSGKLFQLFEA